MKPYTGRLAFNPDTGFHIDPDGKPVVTYDGGRTWRYAVKPRFWRRNVKPDKSHNARYQERAVVIDSTANQYARLVYEHDDTVAAAEVDPHHFAVDFEDVHVSGVRFDPDEVAETITSHTDAYRG